MDKQGKDNQIVGVVPPIVNSLAADDNSVPHPPQNHHNGGGLLLAKAALFENRIKSERPKNSFHVEVTLPPTKSPRCASSNPTPPATPKPPQRRVLPEPKKLLSHRVIFLNDHSNSHCKFNHM